MSASVSGVTLGELQRVNEARKARWHEGGTREWSALEWAGAMCGEAGEAANVAKKILRIDLGLRGNEASEHVITDRDELRKKLEGEIGGVVLYAALLASYMGIDLEGAIVRTFNEKSAEMGFPERLPWRSTDWLKEVERIADETRVVPGQAADAKQPCCARDTDGDGNCDRHPERRAFYLVKRCAACGHDHDKLASQAVGAEDARAGAIALLYCPDSGKEILCFNSHVEARS